MSSSSDPSQQPASAEEPARHLDSHPQAADSTALTVHDDDFYMEGPCVVFTAAYHLRRGSCCHSDCRHCPYRKPNASAGAP